TQPAAPNPPQADKPKKTPECLCSSLCATILFLHHPHTRTHPPTHTHTHTTTHTDTHTHTQTHTHTPTDHNRGEKWAACRVTLHIICNPHKTTFDPFLFLLSVLRVKQEWST